MVNIYIPKTVHGILFIENQDSYTNAITGNPAICKHHIVVYMAGFKGSAARIREQAGVSLHYLMEDATEGKADKHPEANVNTPYKTTKQQLEAWWYDRQANKPPNLPPKKTWPIYFWGDLDYAGMAILKALKQRFKEVTAWQPGYQPMLKGISKQQSHSPDMADKQTQRDPGNTGCDYADTVLLPALRKGQEFVDQEIVFDGGDERREHN